LKIKRTVVRPSIKEYLKAIEVLHSGRYILGEELKSLEEEFAKYCGSRYCVGVNSGTSALILSLLATDVKGKEVITVPNSFVATANAIKLAGGKPVFVDVEDYTFNIDVGLVEEAITNKTKAIVPVDLYGHPCPLDELKEIAKYSDIKIIEDACQAAGSEYKNKKIGSISDLTCFSLFPSKNAHCFGDGGLITTNDYIYYEKIKALRNQGRTSKDNAEYIGYNFRLNEINAGLAREQLKKLDKNNEKRRQIAKDYNEELKDIPLLHLPVEEAWAKHVYHLYTVVVEKGRDELKKYLAENGIETSINYPTPIHRQNAYKFEYQQTQCPVAEELSNMILSLPMHPYLTPSEIEFICDCLRVWTCYKKNGFDKNSNMQKA